MSGGQGGDWPHGNDRGGNRGGRGNRGGGQGYQSGPRGGGNEGGHRGGRRGGQGSHSGPRGGGSEGGYRGALGGRDQDPSRGRGGNRGLARGGLNEGQGSHSSNRGGVGQSRGAGGRDARGDIRYLSPPEAPAGAVEAAIPPLFPSEIPLETRSLASHSTTPPEDQPTGGSGKGGNSKRKKRGKVQGASGNQSLTKDMESLSIAEPEGSSMEISLSHERYLPKRPSFGTKGKSTKVVVNCWDMEIGNTILHRYDIQPVNLFTVNENNQEKILTDNRKRLKRHMSHVFNQMGRDVFSDGQQFLYSLKPLDNGRFPINSPIALALPETEGENVKLRYIIKDIGTISAQPIMDYLTKGPTRTDQLPQDAINMLDNLLRWINKEQYTLIKTGLFSDSEPRTEFVMFKGFRVSVRPQWKLRLNADLTFKAFFPSGNLADVIYDMKGDDMYDSRNWKAISERIKDLDVVAKHYKNAATGKNYSKRHKVYGLSPKSAQEQIIEDVNKSIAEYFQQRYGIKLAYPELPCVKTKPNKDEFIPMELLEIMPFQAPNLDPSVVAPEMVRIAAVKPEQRFRKITDFIRTVIKQSPLVTALRLKLLSPNPVTVEARVLPTPNFTGSNAFVSRGAWKATPFKVPASREVKYAVINFSRYFNALDKTNRDIAQAGRQLGLHLQFTRGIMKVQPAELPNCFRQLRQEGVRLAICILPKVGPYSEIKRACEFQEFLVTQCVKDDTLRKPNSWSNIMLKINGKLGGENWELDGLEGYWGKDIVMVVGADVTHPGPVKINALRKSIAAVVGSVSPNLMKYVAVVKQQDYKINKETHTAREYIDDMEGIFEQLLQAFFKKNNTLPTKVIFYRDGVSEGQFESVVSRELSAMQSACTKLRVGYQPGFTFIVVQKRHHIRFLPVEKELINVNPGTVVDTNVTHLREFDFFLCSQQGIQGTSKPAHYHIVYDDNDLGADELQLFTFYLCHVYMRCTRSVSYPAPTYYAHLAAFRGRDWMKGLTNPERLLENNQFKLLPEQRDLMFFL
nr:eukaryotic translation initiation factor 2c [Hymenolepis microstoma]